MRGVLLCGKVRKSHASAKRCRSGQTVDFQQGTNGVIQTRRFIAQMLKQQASGAQAAFNNKKKTFEVFHCFYSPFRFSSRTHRLSRAMHQMGLLLTPSHLAPLLAACWIDLNPLQCHIVDGSFLDFLPPVLHRALCTGNEWKNVRNLKTHG